VQPNLSHKAHAHPSPSLRCTLQAYAAWPADRLDEIGGSTAYYAQDFLAKQEQGEARRKRALEVFSGWCPQVGGMGMSH